MFDSQDSDFFAHPEATQRRLSARAVDPAIAAIHTQLADEYAAKIPEIYGIAVPLHIVSSKLSAPFLLSQSNSNDDWQKAGSKLLSECRDDLGGQGALFQFTFLVS